MLPSPFSTPAVSASAARALVSNVSLIEQESCVREIAPAFAAAGLAALVARALALRAGNGLLAVTGSTGDGCAAAACAALDDARAAAGSARRRFPAHARLRCELVSSSWTLRSLCITTVRMPLQVAQVTSPVALQVVQGLLPRPAQASQVSVPAAWQSEQAILPAPWQGAQVST